MWSVLGTLISGFLLLRDFFGYMLPGAVLFAAAALSIDVQNFARDRFGSVAWLAASPSASEWTLVVAIVGACYVIGHVLAAVGYLLVGLCGAGDSAPPADLQFYRYRYPSLFIDYDRRDTIALFRVGLAMALILSTFFLPTTELRALSLLTGLLMLFVSCRALAHVAQFGRAAVAAGERAMTANMPAEPRGGGKPAANGKDGA